MDREESENYELLVEAIDQGTPARSSQALVKIMVDDVNDQAPELLSPANKMIYASKSRSTISIGTLIATDKDQNDAITYELMGKKYQLNSVLPTVSLKFLTLQVIMTF